VLIFVTGSVGAFKPGIAYEVSRAFNNYDNYSIGNYTANIHTIPIEVYNADSELVYKPVSSEDPNGSETLLYAADGGLTFVRNIDTLKSFTNPELTYYGDKFNNLTPDLGLPPENTGGSYEEFMQAYENSPFDVHVVSGLFSKNFIERVRADIGETNVVVLCIERNPSITYLIDNTPQATAEWFLVEDMVGQSYVESLLNMCVMRQLGGPNVHYIKFEDIIENGYINVLERTINIPQIVKHNQYITEYEYTNIVPTTQFASKLERLSKINTALTALDEQAEMPQIPHNVFEILGYEQVQPDQVLSP
jgi:hypothetical protein